MRGAAGGWLALAALAAACAGPPVSGPPEVRLGYDVCARCGMLLSDEATAAAARGPGEEVERWDDLECLARGWQKKDRGGWSAWVRDAETGAWLEAERALYVRDPRRLTPMGSGWTARSPGAAEPPSGGKLRSWNELLAAASAADPGDEHRESKGVDR